MTESVSDVQRGLTVYAYNTYVNGKYFCTRVEEQGCALEVQWGRERQLERSHASFKEMFFTIRTAKYVHRQEGRE